METTGLPSRRPRKMVFSLVALLSTWSRQTSKGETVAKRSTRREFSSFQASPVSAEPSEMCGSNRLYRASYFFRQVSLISVFTGAGGTIESRPIRSAFMTFHPVDRPCGDGERT